MAVDAPTPLPWRPSDRERDAVVRALSESTADGRISTDTFSHRVERAYHARSRGELDELMTDLPPRGRLHRSLVRAVERTAATFADVRSAWREPHVERLPCPAAAPSSPSAAPPAAIASSGARRSRAATPESARSGAPGA
jgi:Domain of unknown function (DUF1707)